MNSESSKYFGKAVDCFAANAKRACGPLGTIENHELYDLSLGLECFLRGVVGRLAEIDERIDALEQALVPGKSSPPQRKSGGGK